jgi:hypothetical protein
VQRSVVHAGWVSIVSHLYRHALNLDLSALKLYANSV